MLINPKFFIFIGAVLLAVAVAAGAFGAHALKSVLSPDRLDTWNTAVQYHAWHALGLILVTLVGLQFELVTTWPSLCLLGGILIFSGSLYLLCLTNISWLGAITPIGGLSFIAGWIWFAWDIIRVPH